MDVSDIILWICAVVGAVILIIVFLLALLFVPNPFRGKSVIISYRPDEFTALNAESWTYFLTVERRSFFTKRRLDIVIQIPFSASIRAYHEHWDQLIKTKQPVRL